jgi:hypothetical protein
MSAGAAPAIDLAAIRDDRELAKRLETFEASRQGAEAAHANVRAERLAAEASLAEVKRQRETLLADAKADRAQAAKELEAAKATRARLEKMHADIMALAKAAP